MNIRTVENAIIEIGKARYLFEFANFLGKRADIKRLWKETKKTGNKDYIKQFKEKFTFWELNF